MIPPINPAISPKIKNNGPSKDDKKIKFIREIIPLKTKNPVINPKNQIIKYSAIFLTSKAFYPSFKKYLELCPVLYFS